MSSVEEIDAALNAVKQGDTSKVPILSSLLLVDELLNHVIKKGAIDDLVNIINNQQDLSSPEQVDLIRSCVIALGRIAMADDKNAQDIVQKGGLDSILRGIDIGNPEVLTACVDTLQKLAVNDDIIKQIVEKGCIAKIMEKVQEFPKDEKLAESVLSFVATVSRSQEARDEIVAKNGFQNIFNSLLNFLGNKKVQEQVISTNFYFTLLGY